MTNTTRLFRLLVSGLAATIILMLYLIVSVSVSVVAQQEVNPIGSNAIVTGTTPLTTVAVAILPAGSAVRELLLQCDVASLVDCYIGSSTAQVVHIAPGQSLSIPVANLRLLYARTASSTGTINYLGRK